MNKHVTEKLEAFDDALSELSDFEQAEILSELAVRISNRTGSLMTPEQREIVRERMSGPRDYATDIEIQTLLQRYKQRS